MAPTTRRQSRAAPIIVVHDSDSDPGSSNSKDEEDEGNQIDEQPHAVKRRKTTSGNIMNAFIFNVY
jgi:hypothetical protein